ncbi:hypothetical protein F4776DRAFT_668864 [Hypoxylon sp. NC0597]|nr:hypothetical protein F4776DRAFT_668864 [Hypoxylon sp. NC0597]
MEPSYDATSDIPRSQQIHASMGFLRDLKLYDFKKPYDGVPVTNIRGYEDVFELDVHGFQVARHKTSMNPKDFRLPELIQGIYLQRRQNALADSALKRVQDSWPLEVNSICSGRCQILNVWRPIGSPLKDWPLALCDVRSVNEKDKVKADLIYPGYEGENTLLYFSPHHKFYYVGKQRQDEIWIFKQFDSMVGIAGGCPHGSFKNPEKTVSTIADQSIDIAALVIY